MKQKWMKQIIGTLAIAAGLAILPLPVTAVAATPAAPEARAEAAPWLRIAEERDGQLLQLQVAVREYVHDDASRPRVTIAGAVHIGEESYYQQLQQILDAQEVVLFEGVSERLSAEGEDARVALTRSRMRILASMLEAYRSEYGRYPAELDTLLETWPDAALAKNPRDAWGNALIYVLHNGDSPHFELLSLGADGESGGEESQIRMSSHEPRRTTRPQVEGIQKQMADAMGLVFQLEVMDHSGPGWRNSDMTIEELRDRFRASGVQAERLFGMLDGTSMMGRFSGILLGMMGATEQSRGLLKAMMIEILGQSDRLMKEMPGNAGAMLSVLIDERNEVVLEDLAQLIEKEPHVRSVGIIYGAGHLPHMEQRLVGDFGYTLDSDQWLSALVVDTVEAGIAPSQLRMMRRMIHRSLEQRREPADRNQHPSQRPGG